MTARKSNPNNPKNLLNPSSDNCVRDKVDTGPRLMPCARMNGWPGRRQRPKKQSFDFLSENQSSKYANQKFPLQGVRGLTLQTYTLHL
jgi:hypothetical protein